MTEIKKGYDSFCRETCDLCSGPIEPANPRVVLGTGSSLLAVYHNLCWKEFTQKEKPSPARMMAREG